MIIIKLELSAIKTFLFFIRSSGREFNWKSHFRMTPLKAHLMCERKALNLSCGFNVTTSSRFVLPHTNLKFFFFCLWLSHSKIVKPKWRRKNNGISVFSPPWTIWTKTFAVKIVENFPSIILYQTNCSDNLIQSCSCFTLVNVGRAFNQKYEEKFTKS